MYSLCFLTAAAFLLSLALTPLVCKWSLRLGWVDLPDRCRKQHAAATPRTGGVAVMLSYLGAYALLLLLPLQGSGVIASQLGTVWRLMPAVLLVFLTGLVDDWRDLKPWQKICGQLASAALAYAAGVRISSVAGMEIPEWWSLPLTVAWLILCSNAFNLIDGMDGLAAGVGITATVTTFIAGMLHGDLTLGLATAPLASCLIGFLRYNFSPASIFLGDSGSLSIGFLLGCYAVIWCEKSATMLGVAAPAMALALPLFEVALSVVRRFVRAAPIFTGDHGHIHHLLLERGFTPRRAALLLYGVCGLGAVLSLLGSTLGTRYAALVIVVFGAGAWIGVRVLGYAELEAAQRFLREGLRPTLSAHVQLMLLERSLKSAATIEQCWHALERAAHSLGYSHMVARLAGREFATAAERVRTATYWQMRLNISGRDYVNINQSGEPSEQPVLLIPFVEVVSRVLPERLLELGRASPASGATGAVAPLRDLAPAGRTL